MAIVQNPITGRTKKKFGTAVFSKQFGKNTMRTKPADVRNPKTIPQRQQRNKFSLLVAVARMLMGFIRVTFKKAAVGMSPYNTFVKTNIANVVIGDYPNFTIDYSQMKVSKGSLKGVDDGICSPDHGQVLNISWTDNSGNTVDAQPTDNVLILAINDTKNATVSDMASATRSDANVQITVPLSWVNDNVHVYMCLKVSAQDNVSDSVYLGSFPVLA